MMIDTNLIAHSDDEAKLLVSNKLSNELGVSVDVVLSCITFVTTSPNALCDGEDIYIVHKVTKSNKNKLLYVHFAYWML